MKKYLKHPRLLLAAILIAHNAYAADTAVAPVLGPAISTSKDFNNENAKTNMGFGLGFDAFYRLGCKGCRGLSLMMTGTFTSTGNFNFGATKRIKTGHTGIYKKSESRFNWNIGVNWSTKPVGKVKFNVFAGPGLYYTKIKNESFRNGNNLDLPLPSRSNSKFDFGVMIGGGPEVMLSEKSSLSVTPRYNFTLSDPGGNSSFFIPVSFKLYF